MAVVRCEDPRTVCVGDNPMLEYIFLQTDDRNLCDLTKHSAWVRFWYPGATVHVLRQARVIALSGLVRYKCLGDEFPLVGQVRHQATVMPVDFTEAIDRAYSPRSHPVCRWDVIARPT